MAFPERYHLHVFLDESLYGSDRQTDGQARPALRPIGTAVYTGWVKKTGPV